MGARVLALAFGLVAMGDVWAEPAPRDWHAGLNMRTDFGTRFLRGDLGARLGAIDLIAVVDPLGVSKGDYDLDAVVRSACPQRWWSVFAGMRLTIVPIGRMSQYHDKILLGVSGLLPANFEHVRIHAGLELAVHVVAHGADLPTTWLCADSIACRRDHFVFSLFARVEYASPF
jgi:hypothetical protein